jgi:hypothetical protein
VQTNLHHHDTQIRYSIAKKGEIMQAVRYKGLLLFAP